MGTKMKSLLKGLRYITQIFDVVEEEEKEMQIGFPTDVKHVGHVGCDDGPSSNSLGAPSWMTGYRSSPPKSGTAAAEEGGGGGVGLALLCQSEDLSRSAVTREATTIAREGAAPLLRPPRRKPSAAEGESGGPDTPVAKRDASTSRRRHKSAGSHPAEGSTRRRAKALSMDLEIVVEQFDPLQEVPAAAVAAPKQARRKKTKGGGSGSTRPSRSRGATTTEAEERSGELPPPAPEKLVEEGEKNGDEDGGDR